MDLFKGYGGQDLPFPWRNPKALCLMVTQKLGDIWDYDSSSLGN